MVSPIDWTERQAAELRDRANAEVRRILTRPTDEERARLRPLPSAVALFLEPLPYTPASMFDVLGNQFGFSDVWAVALSTLRNLAHKPIVARGLPKDADAAELLRLSTKTVTIAGRRSRSEREVLLADDERGIRLDGDETLRDVGGEARALLQEIVPVGRTRRARRGDERTFLDVADLMRADGVSQTAAVRIVADRSRPTRDPRAVLQAVRRIKRRLSR